MEIKKYIEAWPKPFFKGWDKAKCIVHFSPESECTFKCYVSDLFWKSLKDYHHKFSNYRIRLNATPLLNRTSPHSKTNTTPVKNWFWNNTSPSRIQPHLSRAMIVLSKIQTFYQSIPLTVQINLGILSRIADWTPIVMQYASLMNSKRRDIWKKNLPF